MKECPKCHASAADTAKFCMKCGFNFKKYEEENAEIFCPECGTKFAGGDFCPECGFNVKNGAPAEAAAPAASTESVFADDNWLSGLGDMTSAAVKDKKQVELDAERAALLAPFTYETHTNGKVTITGLADKHALEIEIPDFVVAIGDGAFEGSSLMHVRCYGNELLKIGNRAFANCLDLVSFVSFPDSLVSIGDEAFLNCESLQESIPDHVKRIGKDAFFGSYPHLLEISLQQEKEAEEKKAKQKANEERLAAEAAAAAEAAKKAASDAKLFTIKDGVLEKYIGKEAEVIVPDGVTAIDEAAFEDCDFITSVTLPSSVTTIGRHAFEGCKKLAEVKLPEGLTTIERGAFWECSSLTSISIPESVTDIGEYVFYECVKLTSVTLPQGLTKISGSTFSYCHALASVHIPAGVKKLGRSAFDECKALKSVQFEKDSRLTRIDSSVFWECEALQDITIPKGVTNIGESAFYKCKALKSATFEATDGWTCHFEDTKFKASLRATFNKPTPPALLTPRLGTPAENAKLLVDSHDYTWKRQKTKAK